MSGLRDEELSWDVQAEAGSLGRPLKLEKPSSEELALERANVNLLFFRGMASTFGCCLKGGNNSLKCSEPVFWRVERCGLGPWEQGGTQKCVQQ